MSLRAQAKQSHKYPTLVNGALVKIKLVKILLTSRMVKVSISIYNLSLDSCFYSAPN